MDTSEDEGEQRRIAHKELSRSSSSPTSRLLLVIVNCPLHNRSEYLSEREEKHEE
jgi:hypothetical protein